MRPGQHGGGSGICLREAERNRRFREALSLFDRISDEIGVDPFKASDVSEYMNQLTRIDSGEGVLMRYGKSHLRTLVEIGLLDHDDSTGSYSINVCVTPPGERWEPYDAD